ncbi:hypothetical protein SAMN05421780_102473 [Flexibacter flexilis DSM 6793]|uniref:Uncharacterized protein n=2 Tax=Flexibacter flexilis TaxID=998 RepID=A0A1I1G6T9_9BACT|nr:hypothetical protein SAMN05421780_102473 [Flexibacter flexilis DSM 6793]
MVYLSLCGFIAMKQYFAIILTAFYLVFGANMGVSLHSCGGNVAVSVLGQKSACSCPMKKEGNPKKGCCQQYEIKNLTTDQHVQAQVDVPFEVAALVEWWQPIQLQQWALLPVLAVRPSAFFAVSGQDYPPPKNPIWLSLNVLRI